MSRFMLDSEAMEFTARTLDEAGIAYCLIGESVLEFYGLQNRLGIFTGFLVPMSNWRPTWAALAEAGYRPCHDVYCDAHFSYPRHVSNISVPLSNCHFHYIPAQAEDAEDIAARGFTMTRQQRPWERVVSFFVKSDRHGYFPNPPAGRPRPPFVVGDIPPPRRSWDFYMLSTDARLPERSRHFPHHYPIKMPTPHRYLEAITYQLCYEKQYPRQGVREYCWQVMFDELVAPIRLNLRDRLIRLEDLGLPVRLYVEDYLKAPDDPTKRTWLRESAVVHFFNQNDSLFLVN
ncbi:uncharacterized protein BO97DRAFT_459758 [Aspergillus homomorphus CBS 101889]|uniref:Uncharacterized protein n=1 Tax=Aspergillus homomorphus (strain CBS 101889) TaxID=1450537 RepID=A0A395HN67_ASPHC|nr:hypothetical protein BO97DRAFT_459758 [Aspergillus homomorphus CBS 101889]RAL08863.1 hypothetical protein BO97DRAFT_459758 [Aspergillus homomorphus CBS 101889]